LDCDAVRLCIDNALACPLINNFQIIGTVEPLRQESLL
jgi:hypothetical protein